MSTEPPKVPDTATMVALIQRRLAVLDQERDALLVLRQIYTAELALATSDSQPPVGVTAPRSVTPDPTRRVEIQPGGMTEVIESAVRAYPGQTASELFDLVEPLVESGGNKRNSISARAADLVKSNRLIKRDGRFYPPNGTGQGREPLADSSYIDLD